MKIIIGIPVVDKHELTGQSLSTTASYIHDKSSVRFVIIDNDSKKPYKRPETQGGLTIDLLTNGSNRGYYYPLIQLYDQFTDADYIGLMHNDAVIYQEGWEKSIHDAFEKDPKLAMVGLFGWQKLTHSGKNENPVGKIYWPFPVDDPENPPVYSQYHRRVHGVTPVLTLDSLFMILRRKVIPMLNIDETITISHGYDKIWSMRLIEEGYHVAVLGIPFLHTGGNNDDPEIRQMFKEWFDKRWEVNSPSEFVYDIAFFETSVLFANEFRDRKKMFPCEIDDQYNITKTWPVE